MEVWGERAYTKAGDVRSAAEAQFINKLYGAARGQLAEKAKLASTGQTALSKLYGAQRFAKGTIGKTIGYGGAGVAGALGGILAGKFLGER